MGIDLVHMWSIDITTPQDQRGRHVALILEEHPLEHGTGGDDPRLTSAGVHPEQIQLRRDDFGGFLGVGCGSGSAAVDVGGEVVDFFAVFVGYFCASCGAGVGSEDHAVFEGEAYDRGSGFGGLWEVTVSAG